MIRNYFKVAIRNLSRNSLVAAINIGGLGLGLAVCLLIGLWTWHELQYDAFHDRSERVVLFQQFEKSAGSGSGLAALLQEQLSGVERVGRLAPTKALLSTRENVYSEEHFYFADSSLFHILSLPLVEGHGSTALATPYGVVLSEKMAIKYFPNQDPIGQTLRFDNKQDLVVTGLLRNLPANSHLNLDFLCSFRHAEALMGEQLNGYWDNRSLTYLLLSEGTAPETLEGQLARVKETSGDQNAAIWKLGLIPLRDIYLYHNLDGRVKASRGIEKVYLFAAISFFVLVLACFNYINMATARATQRAKEVGIRKTIGASRGQLFWQFLHESFVNLVLATAVALLLAAVMLPYFNALAETDLSLAPLRAPAALGVVAGGLLLLCLLTGSYPALVLAAFKPVSSLKNELGGSFSASLFRQVLVVGQFGVSITMMVATLVVVQQLHFMQNKDLGYQQEQVLTLTFPGKTSAEERLLLKQKLQNLAGVAQVSLSSSLPGKGAWFNKLVVDYLPAGTKDAGIQQLFVDEDFLQTYAIDLVAGRNFRAGEQQAGPVYMINEAAQRYLQWEEGIEGKELGYYTYAYTPEGGYREVPRRGPVVGVVRDYHQVDLKSTIAPLLLVLDPEVGQNMAVNLQAGKLSAQVEAIERQWRTLFPDQPFEFSFLDSAFAQTYREEIRTARVVGIFSGFAILISCLGLFGLATFAAERRKKEIGIRKLLGASVGGIVSLVSKDLLKLVLVANLMAWPLAWWGMNRWLEDFAYRIDIPLWLFAGAGAGAALLAFLTISYQVLRAATANPVKNLRTE